MGRRLILLLLTPALLGLWESRSYGDVLRIDHWEQITYYRHTFEAEAAVAGVLRITAIGDYELYLNGTQIAADADWRTTEEVGVDLKEGANHIGVGVAHPGTEAGNGLLLSLQAGSQTTRSSFTDDTSLWLWTGEAQAGNGWTTQDVTRTWNRVQAGTIDRLQVQGGIFHPDAEEVAGYPLSVNVGSSVDGRIVLADQRGRNIALGLNASEVGVTDGVIGAPVWSIPQGLRALNELVDITLPELTRISRVRIITKPPEGNETYVGNSLLGYSVQISEDQSRWIEMAGINDIENFVFTEVTFEPVLARFVRVQVTQAEVGRDPAKVTEIQIYGVDFVPEGAYVSSPLDFGAPDDVKNFGTVQWWAEVPPAAQLGLQFSTGDSPDTTDVSWSAWSQEFKQSGVLIPSPEPRRYLRYRVNFKTADFEFTPALDSLNIDYTAGDIAARDASGSVTPNEAAMGEDIIFRYQANLQLAEGDAVSKIRIRVPSLPTQIQGMNLLGQDIAVAQFPTGPAGIDLGGGRVLHVRPGGSKDLDISFEPPLTVADGSDIPLEILLQAALFTDAHEFRAFLFSPGVENPQNFREDVTDGASWKVIVTDVLAKDLFDVKAVPRILTPNGDGINDFAVIEFTLTKVAEPRRVDVDIFELSGRRVRRLDTPPLIGGRYTNPLLGAAEARFIPGFWDGTNEAGELVPPGIYPFTLRVDLDTGAETASGVVYVVY